MTDPSEPKGTLGQDQTVPIDEPTDGPDVPAFDFEVVNDGQAGIYAAIAGDREVAGLTYDVAGDDRLVLRATSVFPEFRKRGIATELIRRVLDDIREQGKTVTTMCPIVHTFMTNNPEYTDLIDPEHPGLTPVLPAQKI
ncbi:GNAT family N-acetyltransferase [Asanoa sp. NPDC049573]|uniref:GNAT family N-acetyltransferase n=1 Tax=Asanoa sp. NPDC049573 TaxID=3155396 RepID=UPI00342F2A29